MCISRYQNWLYTFVSCVAQGQNFEFKIRRDNGKNERRVNGSYERRVYKSVDDKSLSYVVSQNWTKNRIREQMASR